MFYITILNIKEKLNLNIFICNHIKNELCKKNFIQIYTFDK